MKRFVSILSLAAVMTLTLFTSCENKKVTGDASKLVGDWQLYAVSINGMTMTVDEIKASAFKDIAPYLEQAKATLRNDYTFTVVTPMDGSTQNGTWSYNDGKISFKLGDYTCEATYADDALALPYTVEYTEPSTGIAIPLSVTAYYKKVTQ